MSLKQDYSDICRKRLRLPVCFNVSKNCLYYFNWKCVLNVGIRVLFLVRDAAGKKNILIQCSLIVLIKCIMCRAV